MGQCTGISFDVGVRCRSRLTEVSELHADMPPPEPRRMFPLGTTWTVKDYLHSLHKGSKKK